MNRKEKLLQARRAFCMKLLNKYQREECLKNVEKVVNRILVKE